MNTPGRDEEAIFHEARRIDSAEERDRYLAEACGDDDPLRARILALLAVHEQDSQFLASGGFAPSQHSDRHSSVGPYKLLQEIGEGGMGAVWMAEQQQPVRRKVALKVIKPGLDSQAVLARFEQERQALALMDHPNIAKVLDAGTTADGRPYFVMELIKGVPITRYCDERRLTPRQRLELLVPVCQAVQHAHQKGVIHRDLKPSNILVCLYDGKAVPKVIDFGVAKATGPRLTERTLFTEFGQVVGTLEYMSPEQAELNNLDIDTRSDVYSLGVLLYELLTGTTPLDGERLKRSSLLEVLRIIREEEPERPSTRLSGTRELPTIAAKRGLEAPKLSRLVRDELDWVVMKCLEKDRDRRYESANALAADVLRYLSDEPVLACPPSVWYRAKKLARRHKVVVLLALAVLAALAAITVSYWQVRAALGQRNEAFGVLAGQKWQLEQAHDVLGRTKNALDDSLKAERHVLSVYSVSLAGREWEEGRPRLAERALDGCPPGNRLWEWHYLKRLCNADLYRVVFTREMAWPTAAGAFSLDGARFVSVAGTPDPGCRVWDVNSGRVAARLFATTAAAYGSAMAFSPDGKWVAASVGLTRPAVYDAATGARRTDLVQSVAAGRARARRLAFSPGGRRVAAVYDDKLVVVHAADDGKELVAINLSRLPRGSRTVASPDTRGNEIAFSADGRHLAVACYGFDNRVTKAPDGSRLRARSGWVRVYDSRTGKEVRTLAEQEALVKDRRGTGRTAVTSLAYCPAGKYLAAGDDDGVVRQWDAATGEPAPVLTGHQGAITALCYSRDGRLLASGGADRTVRVWESATGRAVVTHRGHDGEIHGLAFSADGTRVTSAGRDATLRTWATATTRNPLVLDRRPVRVAFSANADRMASVHVAEGTARGVEVCLWDTVGYRLMKVCPLRTADSAGRTLIRFEGGRCLAVVQEGARTYAAVDVESGQVVRRFDPATAFAYLCPTWNRTAKVEKADGSPVQQGWQLDVRDTTTGRTLLPLGRHRTPPRVLFHPDGRRLVLLSNDGPPRVLDQAGNEQATLEMAPGALTNMAFSPDGGQAVAFSSRLDSPGDLRLYDLRTGNEIRSFSGHPRPVVVAAFSPDGQRLASVCNDRLVKVWDVRTGRELLTLRGFARSLTQLAFSPDGHWLATVEHGGATLLWDGRPWRERPGRVIDLSAGSRPDPRAAPPPPTADDE